MYGESSLKAHTARYGDKTSKMCLHCDMFEIQSVSHFLFDCNNADMVVIRERWQEIFDNEFPLGLVRSMELMSSNRRTLFIITGLENSYVQEWENVYICLCDFIADMYSCHTRLLAT